MSVLPPLATMIATCPAVAKGQKQTRALQHKRMQKDRLARRPCENSNARRARRNIFVKLSITKTDDAADVQIDAALKNCIFYISPMYEFSHDLLARRSLRNPIRCFD